MLLSYRLQKTLLFLLLLIAILLPRATQLKRFVTVDENRWLTRSGNFYRALSIGKLEQTYQSEHPGVTIMWLGSAAFWWHYPAYAQEAPDEFEWKDEQIERFLRSKGYDPLDLLATGRFLVALAITFILGATFLLARPLLGENVAWVGFLLIAFDPFHVAFSRQLHLDGMMSSLMLFSLLAFLLYLYQGRQLFFLALSAIGASLAWLTRTPSAFMGPFIALVALVDWAYRQVGAGLAPALAPKGQGQALPLQGIIMRLFVWGMIGVAVFVLMWPAMWVAPFETLQEAISEGLQLAEGHSSSLFFDGQIIQGDPGSSFYPINFLWRTTPLMLLGILAALGAYLFKLKPLDQARIRQVFAVLMLFVLTFMLFVTLSDKKYDRYMLPIFAPLDLVAGMGWLAVWQLIMQRQAQARPSHRDEELWPKKLPTQAGRVLIGLVLLVQALLTLRMAPYYLAYYNPLLGDTRAAANVMMLGWGDGLEKVADYLNRKPDAKQLQVMASYWEGCLSYFFEGRAKPIWEQPAQSLEELLNWVTSDYAAFYITKWQREPLTTPIRRYFSQLTPEYIVTLHGVEYAWLYNIQGILPPAEYLPPFADFIDWHNSIRLVAHKLPSEPILAGESLQVEFYLQNLAPIERDLHVLMRIVGKDGQEVARSEGWPWGSPTSTWQIYDVWPDGHEFVLPADSPPGFYRIELGFYDPKTFEHLPATDPYTSEALGDTVVIDYLFVGEADSPASPLSPPAILGEQIRLLGTDQNHLSASNLKVRLFWQSQAKVQNNYTVFVHLIGPDGQLIAQQDQQPLTGFFPTSFWRPNQIIPDDYELQLPPDLPSGSYELRVGMYDPSTLQRLPVMVGGELAGDFVVLGMVQVE